MKLFIVIGLCAFAIANRHGWNDVQKEEIRDNQFRTEREYLFRYNGQISTGLHEGSNQQAATRLQADVSLVFTGEKTAVLQIAQVRFGNVNRELPEPRDVQPFEVFENKEIDEDHKKLLKLPLRFRYVDGLVSEIEFDSDDKPWSENIKRGILNMLQVNIKKNTRKDDSEERQHMKNIDDREDIDDIQKNYDFFRTQEKTLEGDCETLYTFNKPVEQERSIWKISKSVNFEKCRERVDIRYNFRFGQQCEECNELIKEQEPSTKSSTVFNFEIKGTKDKFLIEKVEVRSQYVFAPLSKQDKVVVTFVANKLELVKVKENVERLPEIEGGLKGKQSLLYSPEREIKMERFYMRGDEEIENDHPFKDVHNKFELIEQTILRLLHVTSDKEVGMESEVTHQLARLVDLLRMCSKPELRKVHEELYENSEKFEGKKLEQVRDILIDALALAGTRNTIEHLVEKIETRKMTVVKAVKALQSLVNVRIISKEQIEHVFGLCNKETTKRSPVLRQTCLLTVGGMINGLCRDNKDRLAVEYTNEKYCPRELKERYLQDLMEIFKTAETRYEKVLALKTIANAGIDVGVFELEKIIYDRKQEKIIRTQAIDALRQLREVMPRKIQKILLPLFKNRQEHPEIRMNALVHLMYTIPSRPILDQVAHTLYNERSRQVLSFTYTMMKTFSNSKIPCEKKLAEDLQTSLLLARVPIESWTDSKFVHMPFYHHHHKMGLSLDLASIFMKDNLLPREMMASIDTHFLSWWTKQSLQIGFTQYNLEQMLEKILKTTGDKSLEDIVVRGKRSSSFRPIDLLRNLYEKLNVRSRRGEESNMALDIYFRKNGLDFAIIPLDEDTIPETLKVMREGKIDLTRLEHLLGQGFRFNTHFGTYFYETSRRIPTSIGLPLIVAGKMPTVVGINGDVKVELTPKKSERLDGAKVFINIRPAIASTHITQVYLWNPISFSGMKMIQSGKLDLPISMTVDFNVEDKVKITYKIKVPEEKRQVMWMHTRVMTVTSSWPKNVKTYVEPKEKTVQLLRHEQRLKTVEKTFGEKLMGIRFNVRGQYHENPLRVLGESPVDFLLGENIFEVYMEPGQDVPTHILGTVIFDLIKQDRMEKPEFERFYSEQSDKEMFEIDVDEDEYYTSRGSERRLRNEEDEEPRQNSRRRVRKGSESSEEEEWSQNRHIESRLRDSGEEESERRTRSRHPQKERERHEEFGRYLREYKPEGGYKLKMEMNLETTGSNVERKGHIEITTSCDERIRYCRLKVNGRRTPLFENERSEWTVKMDMETLYPQQVRSLQELKEKKHREFNAQVKCEWGSQKKQQFHMKIQGEQSKEQRRWLNNVEGKSKKVERYNEILRATQLNQYKVCVNYEFEPSLKSYVNKIFNVLKSWNLWNSKVTPTQNEKRQIFARFTIDPRTQQYLTMTVECPSETVEVKDLRLPVKVAPLMLNIHRHETPVRSLRHFVKKTVSERRAECKVSDLWVNTFDDTEIKVPITTCYSVLAKDCTSEQPKFAVLMKKVKKNSELMKMKIMDEERVIEIVNKEDVMEVTVDGRKIDDEERLQSMGISRKDEMVVVELEDVLIRFDGRTASVKMSPLYKNGQCGICGHYDDEQDDELRKADNELTEDVEEYHRSYFANDEECEIEEEVVNEKKNYRHELRNYEDDEFSSNDELDKETKKPVMRTKVIEYNHELCFSTKPVPECPKDTYMNEDKTTDKKVSFACLSRSKHESSKLARRARTEVINMEKYKPSFVDTVQVPQECLVF